MSTTPIALTSGISSAAGLSSAGLPRHRTGVPYARRARGWTAFTARTHFLFDGGWRFVKGDPSDATGKLDYPEHQTLDHGHRHRA